MEDEALIKSALNQPERTVKLDFADFAQSERFMKNICLPYFRDIYHDLAARSETPHLGISKLTLLDYMGLPVMFTDRIMSVLDVCGRLGLTQVGLATVGPE